MDKVPRHYEPCGHHHYEGQRDEAISWSPRMEIASLRSR
jgi:hypothetical protein